MADKRMISKKVIHSDDFMDLPATTKNLYFYLMIEADDDGFVNSPKRIQRMVGGTDDDARLLLSKKFLIAFESGVIIIKHWKMHNYIRSDRYKATTHTKEAEKLHLKDNGVYTLDTVGIPMVDVDKNRLDKNRLDKSNSKKPFTFILTKKTSIENTSKNYQEKLKAYIESSNKSMTYKEFFDKCVLKDYKYKDFKRAYDSWNKNTPQTAKGKRMMALGGRAI